MDIKEMEERMKKVLVNLSANFNTLRTGRANPTLLDSVYCEYYGDKMLIKDIAMISVPEPRQLLIQPYDSGDIKTIAAAINASEIGINPIVDAKQIRLVMPPLTEDRRKELAKKAKNYGEEAKVAIRNIRRDAMDEIKKDKDYTEDTRKREEEAVQKSTDLYIKKVDDAFKQKEKDIMSI